MKFMIAVLIILNSFTLFAGLKKNKIFEAVIKAQFEQIKDHFFYELAEDSLLVKSKEVEDQSFIPKIYGPYQLVLKGIDPGTRFDLYSFNVLGMNKPLFVGSGCIDKNGEAWIKEKEGDVKLAHYMNSFGGMLPGEPMYAMVVLENQKAYIVACVVPNPLEAYGQDGRHFTMQLFTPRDPEYLVRGENFKPNEEIKLEIHSIFGVKREHLRASKKGTFIVDSSLKDTFRPARKPRD